MIRKWLRHRCIDIMEVPTRWDIGISNYSKVNPPDPIYFFWWCLSGRGLVITWCQKIRFIPTTLKLFLGPIFGKR